MKRKELIKGFAIGALTAAFAAPLAQAGTNEVEDHQGQSMQREAGTVTDQTGQPVQSGVASDNPSSPHDASAAAEPLQVSILDRSVQRRLLGR